MKIRAIALAVPLAFAAACQHSSRQGASGTAAAPQPQPQEQQAAGGAPGAAPLAEDPLMRPGPSIQGHAEDQIVAGHIAEVSGTEVTIATRDGDTRTLQVVDQTAVELDGMEASADDLTEGQPVRASFDVVDGQEVAVKIRAGDAAAAFGEPQEQDPGALQGTGSSAERPVPAAPADPATPAPDRRTAPDAGWGPPASGGR